VIFENNFDSIFFGKIRIQSMKRYDPEIFANRCAGRSGTLFKNQVVGRGRRRSVRLGQFSDGDSSEWLVAKSPRRGQESPQDHLECFEVPITDAETVLPVIAAFHRYMDMHFPETSDQVLVKVNVPTIWRRVEEWGPAARRGAAGSGRRRGILLPPTPKEKRMLVGPAAGRRGGGLLPPTPKETRMLVEPFIDNFEYFNTNTGWACEAAEVMQALSHFSYHFSGGKKLLCDLQGEWLEPENTRDAAEHNYVLTKMSFMTLHRRAQDDTNTSTDLGAKGVENFFSLHRCNQFCSHSWKTWSNAKQHFHPCEVSQIKCEVEGLAP
jgi:hypothetical protein